MEKNAAAGDSAAQLEAKAEQNGHAPPDADDLYPDNDEPAPASAKPSEAPSLPPPQQAHPETSVPPENQEEKAAEGGGEGEGEEEEEEEEEAEGEDESDDVRSSVCFNVSRLLTGTFRILNSSWSLSRALLT